MTIQEVKTMLEAVGIPVAYDHYENDQALPYIVFKETSTRTLSRDDAVGVKIATIQVELYTKSRNLTLEELLEAAMADMIWRRTLDFDDDEYVYSSFYEFEIIK